MYYVEYILIIMETFFKIYLIRSLFIGSDLRKETIPHRRKLERMNSTGIQIMHRKLFVSHPHV